MKYLHLLSGTDKEQLSEPCRHCSDPSRSSLHILQLPAPPIFIPGRGQELLGILGIPGGSSDNSSVALSAFRTSLFCSMVMLSVIILLGKSGGVAIKAKANKSPFVFFSHRGKS